MLSGFAQVAPLSVQRFESLNDRVDRSQLGAYPAAALDFRNRVSCSRASKRIEDNIALFRRQLNDAIKELNRQFVGPVALLVLGVPDGMNVIPNVGQIHSFGIHLAFVTTVVTEIGKAFGTNLHRQPIGFENSRLFTFAVVEQRVVGRIESSLDGKRVLDVNRDPVTKGQVLIEYASQEGVPALGFLRPADRVARDLEAPFASVVGAARIPSSQSKFPCDDPTAEYPRCSFSGYSVVVVPSRPVIRGNEATVTMSFYSNPQPEKLGSNV